MIIWALKQFKYLQVKEKQFLKKLKTIKTVRTREELNQKI